jgi:hypothetical protein
VGASLLFHSKRTTMTRESGFFCGRWNEEGRVDGVEEEDDE